MSIHEGPGKAPRPIWLAAGAAAATAALITWSGNQGATTAILAGIAVLLPAGAYLADRGYARSADLDLEKVADRLADLVRAQWTVEAARREIEPLLEVSWRPADPSLVASWAELTRLTARGVGGPRSGPPAADPDGLAGGGSRLLDSFDRTPCGRMVVLGEAGAGKTVLLLRLVLDLLGRRQPGEPVPLLLPLASWNPGRQSLNTWLEQQIRREYPTLSAPVSATGDSRARALLHAGLILPVLDGLDEIHTGNRGQALTEINAALRDDSQLVVSCRPDAFRETVRPGPDVRPIHLAAAAGIHLDPVSPATVTDYLVGTAGDSGQDRWASVQAALADPASPVARALATPLIASLARTIYNPRPGEFIRGLPDPSDLTALPTRQAVEQHLFDGYLPAAYRAHPDQPTRWTTSQATRYLVFLAHHLEHRLETTTLSWWELSRATPRALSILVYGLTSGLAFGLADGPAVGLALGFVFGLAVGPAVELLIGSASPGRMALRPPRLFDLAVGLTIGVAVGLTDGLTDGLTAGLTTGLPFGLVLGLVVGIRLDPTAETRRATDPRTILVQDRASGLAMGLVLGLTVGLTVGFTDNALTAGLPAGLTATLTFVLGSAWGRLGVTRLWLAARRKQPLCLIAFLTDAHDRGVLRQAGAVWEFRHSNLQSHLANRL